MRGTLLLSRRVARAPVGASEALRVVDLAQELLAMALCGADLKLDTEIAQQRHQDGHERRPERVIHRRRLLAALGARDPLGGALAAAALGVPLVIHPSFLDLRVGV